MKTALLLSGGMDSLALAWWKRPDFAITIDYGQLAAKTELRASAFIAALAGMEHHVLRIDCRAVGSGDMAGQPANSHAPASDWWPYRNQMLITFAAMKALRLGASKLLIGTVKSDVSHRDGSAEFVSAINDLVRFQEGGIEIEAPAMQLDTAQLIRRAGVPAGVLMLAHSCHKAEVSCGNCRGCNKYFNVLRELEDELDGLGGAIDAP